MAPLMVATEGTARKPTSPTIRGDSLSCCFSVAAYAKSLIHHLRTACNIPVLRGLSDPEFSAIEASLRFAFPPDLRSVLREGLPSSPAFPNWRLSTGPRPIHPEDDDDDGRRRAPVLVPVYRHFYIPSTPDSASGNPIFSVRGGRVSLAAFDLAGFFGRFDEFGEGAPNPRARMGVPAWAATAAQRIEVWTDLAEWTERRRVRISGAWWGGDRQLEQCVEGAWRRLKDGGWREEEVREMMMVDSGHSRDDDDAAEGSAGYENPEWRVRWHVSLMSSKLLRAGWSTEDVAYSLGHGYEGGCLLAGRGRGRFFPASAVACL